MANHSNLSQPGDYYKDLFNQINQGYALVEVVYDETGRAIGFQYIEANKAAERIAGTHLAGKSSEEINHFNKPQLLNVFARVAESGNAEQIKIAGSINGGYYQLHVLKVGNSADRKAAILYPATVPTDIDPDDGRNLQESDPEGSTRTYRVEAEYLRAILQSISDAVYIGDSSGINLANQPALDQLGYQSFEQLHKNVTDLSREIQTRDAETHEMILPEQQGFIRALKGEHVAREIMITHLGTGTERIVRSASSPVIVNKKIVAAVAVNTDITEQWEIAALLRQNRERQTLLLMLSDELSRLTNPNEIAASAGSHLGTYLGLSICVFADLDDASQKVAAHRGWNSEEVPGLEETIRMADQLAADFQRGGQAGETLIVCDTAHDQRVNAAAYARLKVGSFFIIPFYRGGRWTHFFAAGTSCPRDWKNADIAFLRDVSDRVFPRIERARAEEALRESEKSLLAMANSVLALLWETDRAGQKITLTDRWLEFTGQTREETQNWGWLAAIHPDDLPRVKRIFAGAFDGCYGIELEQRIRSAAGEYRWFQVQHQPVFDETGKVKQWFGAAIDVQERKTAEATLQQSEVKYRTIFNSVDEGLHIAEVIYDEKNHAVDFRLLQVNPAFEQHTGIRNATGKLGSQVLPDSENYWLELYDKVVKTGEPHHFENYNQSTGRWYHAYVFRLGDAGSRQVSMVFSDITERKVTEERQAFLLELSDTLRAETGIAATGNRAVKMIAKKLNADRVYLVTLNPDNDEVMVTHEVKRDDMPPLQGSYHSSDFPAAIKEIFERTIVYDDVRTDTRLTELDRLSFAGLGAVGFIAASIRRGDDTMIWAAGALTTESRSWRSDEISLFEDAVERTWAAIERAKAEEALKQEQERYRIQLEQEVTDRTAELSESRNLLQATLDSSMNMTQVFRAVRNESGVIIDFIWILNNAASEKLYGEVIGKSLLQLNPGVKETGIFDYFVRVTETGIPQEYEKRYQHEQFDGWFHQSAVKLDDGVATSTQDITARKEAEIALKENRDLLQSILDTSLIGMSVLKAVRDSSGQIVDFEIRATNQEINRETQRNDLVGKLYTVEYPGVKISGIYDIILEVMKTGKPGGTEYFYPHEGFNKWYSCMFVKLDDGVVATNLDISERKKAEQHLLRSEERLRLFVSASSDLIYRMSADWTEMYALESDNFLMNTTAVSTNWMSRYIPAAEQPRLIAAVEEAIAVKRVFELEHQVNMRNGNTGWAYSRAVPVLNDQGDLLEWFGIATDITARKLAEDERYRNFVLLQQSEELAGTGSWDYDLLTGAFTWSDGMYRLFNLEKEKEVRPEIYLQYATDDCRDVAARVAGHIKRGDAEFEETIEIKVGRSIKVVSLKATVIINEDGNPVRVLGVDMDVTATRQAAETLRQLEARQQQEIFRITLQTQEEERKRISESLHNGLGQLLYGIKISMHELTASLAMQKDENFASAKRYTEELLTDAIKESRKISHELMPMVLDEFGLVAAVEDVCQQLQDGVKFHCRIQLNGIKLDKYLELAVYRTVQELMLNVVKHAAATTAHVDILAKEGKIMIRVEDNGKGLAVSHQEKAGIGLASIRSKASLLNGGVDLTSGPGGGTIAEVWLATNANLK